MTRFDFLFKKMPLTIVCRIELSGERKEEDSADQKTDNSNSSWELRWQEERLTDVRWFSAIELTLEASFRFINFITQVFFCEEQYFGRMLYSICKISAHLHP